MRKLHCDKCDIVIEDLEGHADVELEGDLTGNIVVYRGGELASLCRECFMMCANEIAGMLFVEEE